MRPVWLRSTATANFWLSGLGYQYGPNSVDLFLPDIAVGTYTGEDVGIDAHLHAPLLAFNDFFFTTCPAPCSDITIEITVNEGPGGYVEGTFEGELHNTAGNGESDQPLSGSFRVKYPE